MTSFLTRVQLSDAEPSDYLKLDEEMSARQFARTHASHRGIVYQLPEGTYVSQSFDLVAKDVRDLAIAAASGTGKGYDVVTVAGDIAFSLHPAR